jgi:hypothetical protein
MIPSSHRNPKNKAIAEVLAMIADAHPQSVTNCESNESLWENATEFCAALDRLARESFTGRTTAGRLPEGDGSQIADASLSPAVVVRPNASSSPR